MGKTTKSALPALAGLGIFAALLMSATALVKSSESDGMTRAQPAPAKILDVTVRPEYKLGSDGKRHDAYSDTEFAVNVNQPLTLRIDNTDTQPHSITSKAAGVDIVVMPGTHDYTLIVHTPGRFAWRCMFNCDTGAAGWAMTHRGYMSGYITAS